jgi:carbon monoxide dehydrogenase subunit G
MAMTMTGEATLPAARSRVWALLNDPEILKGCIPGCQSLEKVGDNGFAAVAKVKIGPVSATFKGKVELTDIVPDVGYTISGEGEGGVAGFAKGGAKVSLTDSGDGTLLRYDVEAHVGGKMAQLGSRLIDGVAKGMADKFFASFAAEAAKATPAAEALAHPAHAEAHVTHHFSAEPNAPAAAPESTPARAAGAAPQPTRPAEHAPTAAAAAPVSPPKKTSWFRRIWRWFMSR